MFWGESVGLFWRGLNIILLLAGVAGILYPSFIEPRVGFTQAFLSLFHPDASFAFAMRWLLAILFLIALYAFILGRMYRGIPITVLSSAITIKYMTPDGSTVLLQKEQTVRANQANVTALFNTHATTSTRGRMPKDSVSVSVYAEAVTLNDRTQIYGQEGRSLEVIHFFETPLPFAWFMPLIPVWFLSGEYDRIIRPFRKYVVRRANSVIYENEFNHEPVMRFTTETYPTFNVVITIDFSETNIPPRETIQAMRMKNHGVTMLIPEYNSQTKKIVYRLNEMRNERLLLTWEKPV